MKLAIFASGSGSNAEAIIQSIKVGELQAEAALIICDKPHAKVFERAERLGIPCVLFQPKTYSSKQKYEEEIISLLRSEQIDFIVLAGYMRLIGSTMLGEYEGKMVNIHPSLLPAFPGLDAIGQAFEAKVKETGVTIHYVDEGMDTGPIVAQETVSIDYNETRETLTKKIQQVEHRLYPKTLQKIFSERKVGGKTNE
ncbi:phosphoribosylglycinamide formyltransferase [Bacillus sp. TS-2]|nr:phosphoribosylglycinamide formyltransferase [Bacillus sp. TS-2]